MKKLLIITDAWYPQINGVVRTLDTTASILKKQGFCVDFLTPKDFYGFPWPFYKEISISLPLYWVACKKIKKSNPTHIHIATEGVIGLMGKLFCERNKIKYTTSYHTRFPEYLKKMHMIPLSFSYKYLRWFHSKSSKVLVPTYSMKKTLDEKGFSNTKVWHRGVDSSVFKPYPKDNSLEHPVLVYVGRVSVEKNIKAFLDLNIHGTKIVVGDGPIKNKLQKEYPSVMFLGSKKGEELAKAYSLGNVFVFPSKSDTYGLVLLEALACGVPFAAYKEPGPCDIIETCPILAKNACFIDDSLENAVINALRDGKKEAALELSKVFSWENCTDIFLDNLKECK